MSGEQLFGRRCSLLLLPKDAAAQNNPSAYTAGSDEALDLSEMHITFDTRQGDEESPGNAVIRVENLSKETENRVQEEFSRAVLQAGYAGAPFGVIFDGQIKQFRKGRMDGKTTYLELLCADGDLGYNYAYVSRALAAGSTPDQRVRAVIEAMAPKGISVGDVQIPDTGGALPRGKVLFGLARAALRQIVRSQGATWSIDGGRVNVTPLDSYRDGEAVVLTAQTGLIGRAEQTEQGVRARCLINPRIVIGGLVKIDNASINQTLQAPTAFSVPGAQLAFDKYAGLQLFADTSADGLYRVYVVECNGDNRGEDWYMDLILLTVDPSTNKVAAK